MSEETDVNKNSVEDNGEKDATMDIVMEIAVINEGNNVGEEGMGGEEEKEEEEEEEEYQPKKRAAVKRKLQAAAKLRPVKIIKVTENGDATPIKPNRPGRPRGPGRPKGRPGRSPGTGQAKVLRMSTSGRGRGRKKTVIRQMVGEAEDGENNVEEVRVMRKKSKRNAVKKVNPDIYVEQLDSETDEDYEYELCEYNGHLMAVKPQEFRDEVVEAVSKWEAEWTKKEAEDVLTTPCPLEGCNIDVPNRDTEIHAQCHKEEGADTGFSCIHKNCDYEHAQWQNVRTHISKSHRSLLEVWRCDQPDCAKQFSRWVSLRRHIMYKHIYESTSQILALQHPISKEDYLEKKVKKISRESDVPMGPRKKPRKPVVPKTEKKVKKVIPKEIPKNRVLKCNRCFATYKGEEALNEHMERHTQVVYTKCAECDEYFTEDRTLQKHLKDNHGQLLHQHRCQLCSYTSSYVSDLKIHQYTHQDTKFECDCCGQVCANPKTLRSHRMRKHPDRYEDKSLMCSFCGQTCPNEVLLQDHARDKHHLRLNGAKRINTKEELRFPCNLCDYVGRKQKSLEYHMRLHQEERPFKCTHCNYASKTQNNLKLHMRTHKEMAPLKCPQCEFRGATNKVINQHVMSKHTKEKPYKCTVCSWSTCYSGNLWTHMQIHRKKDGIELPERPKTRKRSQQQQQQQQQPQAENIATVINTAEPVTTANTTQADLAMATIGLPQSVLSSVGLTTSVLSSVAPTPGAIPVAVSSHLPSSTMTVPVSLSIDFPVIQMAQPLIHTHQQQTQQVTVAQQQQDQQQQSHIQQAHADATVHQVQQRYPAQPFAAHIIPPVTSEGFQLGPEPNQAQMVDIQIQDASRRSVVGTIPRQADDDMETVQQLVNLSNMLPTATSVLHNMQPAYARY